MVGSPLFGFGLSLLVRLTFYTAAGKKEICEDVSTSWRIPAWKYLLKQQQTTFSLQVFSRMKQFNILDNVYQGGYDLIKVN